MARIPTDEYRRRLELLQGDIRTVGLDLFIVSAPESIYYLTGAGFEPLERPFFLLVPAQGRPDLLVPLLDYEHMKKARNVGAENLYTYREYPAPPGLGWREALRDRIGDCREIGIERTLPMGIAEQLSDYTLRLVPLIERLRLIKSDAEIQMIERAAWYADFGVQRLLAASYRGATVAEGFVETRRVMSRIIRQVDDWDPLTNKVLMATWAAPRSAMPHSVPELGDRLRGGPHVGLVLTRVNGYAAESERTYFTSEPSAESRRIFRAMMEARRLALRMIRPNLPCSEVDGKVNEFLTKEGYEQPTQRLHRTGHGIGLGNHEAPWIAEGSEDRLAENMVISVEPGIYAPGLGGFRHSDTVLVTSAGHRLLTSHPVELDDLVIRQWKPLARLRGQVTQKMLAVSRKETTFRPATREEPLESNSTNAREGQQNAAFRKPVWQWMRRAAAIVAVLVLVLAIFVVLNALRLPSKQTPTAVGAELEVDAEKAVRTLREFLTVPSYSSEDASEIDPQNFYRLHEILERRFPEAHRVLQREKVNDLSLLYRWEGRDSSLEPILLMAHLDVVPIEEGTRKAWKHSADQEGVVADGFVWGRGALDVKCGVIGIMAAVETLIENQFVPERTIYLAFGHDEEVGGTQGNAAIAKYLGERGTRLSLVLDEGGAILDGVVPGAPRPVAFIAIAEKRMAQLKVTAYGKGGHGSISGRSAILNLAELITRIDQHPMRVRLTEPTEVLFDFLGPEMPWSRRVVMGNRWLFRGLIGWQFARTPSTSAVVRSTLNVTQLNTEAVGNQNAAIAKATIDVRLLPGDTAEQARDHVLRLGQDLLLSDGTRALACEIECTSRGELVSRVDCPEFQTLQRTIHETFPNVIVAAGLTAVSTDSRWYYDLTDNVYRFIPMRLKPADIERIHGVNERISVKNMNEIISFYFRLLQNTAKHDCSAYGTYDANRS